MPISLNCKNKSISYDNRIDYYIDMNKFVAELVFSFELPVLLSHISECYCIEVSDESFELDILQSSRRLIVAGTRNWITTNSDNEALDIRCGKTEFYTSMVIALEIKKDEINDVIDMFSNTDVEELKVKHNTLLQNVLEIVLYRYNEKSGGDSFLTPSYKDCKHYNLAFYINHINKKHYRCHFADYHMELLDYSEDQIIDEEFTKEIVNWRYFYNKCKYEISRCKYIDSIISAAISIESYAWYVIRLNCKDDESITAFSKGEDGEFLSATGLFKKLKDSGWLNTSLSKSKLSSEVQRVLAPRNKIMHGESSVNNSWKTKAENICYSLTELYNDLGENVEVGHFLDNIDHNTNHYIYRDYVIKCNNGFGSPEIMKEESLKIMKLLPETEVPKVQYIKALFELNKNNDAVAELKKLLESTFDKAEVLTSLYYSLLNKYGIDETISLFEGIDEQDERVCGALAGLYLYKYKNNKQDDSFPLIVIDYIQRAKNQNRKYLAPAYIEWDLYREMKNPNELLLIKNITDYIPQDYYMPLLMACHMMKENNTEQVVKYFDIFINRFRDYHYKGIMIDFMCFMYDLEYVKSLANQVLVYLSKENIGTISKQNELDESYDKPLEGICSVDYQIDFSKGEMPLQNLFYREIPMVGSGYYLYK